MPVSRSLTAIALTAALFAGGCDRQTAEPAQPGPETGAESAAPEGEQKTFNGTLSIENRGARMPDFALSDPAGRKLTSADLQGKPVLINLWATWCGPCVLEMPMLDKLASDGKLRVVTVSEDIAPQNTQKVGKFFAERQFAKLEPWLDPDNALSQHYATGILPTTVLYDAQGREVWRMIGGHDWAGPRTTALLADTVE